MVQTGAVVFIGLLLLMAGIEPNPGPPAKVFTFRYQYLLIEVGTIILRCVFDFKVGNDFVKFLKNPLNSSCAKQLAFLLNKGTITPEQQKLILQTNHLPSSSVFDITLLSCLLRNSCGLKQHGDISWINPPSSDTCAEADITRLRKLRNELMHCGSVFDDEIDLDAKWKTLCLILTRLGSYCGMAQIDVQAKLTKHKKNLLMPI